MGGAWKPANKLTQFLAWLVMFGFISVTFGIFRAPSLEWVISVVISGNWFGSMDYKAVALVTLSMTLFFAAPLVIKLLMDRYLRPNSIWQDLYYVAATVAMLAYLNSASPDFIYFQF